MSKGILELAMGPALDQPRKRYPAYLVTVKPHEYAALSAEELASDSVEFVQPDPGAVARFLAGKRTEKDLEDAERRRFAVMITYVGYLDIRSMMEG